MSSPRTGREGVALVVTLLALVLIMTLAWEIFRLGARGAQTGAYARDSIRASIAAEAGAAAARIALKEDAKDSKIDTLDEIWSRPAAAIDLGDAVVRVVVEDEERKINVNGIIMPNGNAPNERNLAVFRRLLENLSLDPSLADAVLDWLDNDESTRVGGAESSYYESLPQPYRSKNDLLDTLDELRLVRGFTEDVFRKLRPFVTVRSSGKVNVNTAPKPVLMSLSAGQDAAEAGEISEATADAVIEARTSRPFEKVDDFCKTDGALDRICAKTQVKSLVDVKSVFFRVRSEGEVFGTIRIIEALGPREGNDIQWRYWRLE